MSSFPNFSNVAPYIVEETNKRKDNVQYLSELNAWVRISSGVGDGLIIVSNADYKLLSAAGDEPSIYGNNKMAGIIGKTWNGKPVYSSEGQGYRPSPIITSIDIDEGAGSISRKAKFSLTAHTREQMEELTKYFLEPGFTIFLEWGWNRPEAFIDWNSTFENADDIAKFQSFKETAERRLKSLGMYDNYLGYITAGGISIENDKWKIDVECTGFTELPAYLNIDETGDENKKDSDKVKDFSSRKISSVYESYKMARFMRMFNELPDVRKVKTVKELIDSDNYKDFDLINFDGDTRVNQINNKTDGNWLFFKNDATITDEEIKFPRNTELVNEKNKFVRFGFLMNIINDGISVDGYIIGEREISIKIDTSKTYISAFKGMFSTDIDKLFIPNGNTPNVSSQKIIENEIIQQTTDPVNDDLESNPVDVVKLSNPIDNRVITKEGIIEFPRSNPLTEEAEQYSDGNLYKDKIEKNQYEYGKLDDLYVNFEFVKRILNTKNFSVKDALYQILNGMSSAVEGLWDFQIQETDGEDDKSTILKVIDLNFVQNHDENDEEKIWELDLIGTNSVFDAASFKLDMGGAMMNQIIGQRLQTTTNSSNKQIPRALFSVDKDGTPLKDRVLNKIEKRKSTSTSAEVQPIDQDEEEIKEEALKLFLDKITLLPKSYSVSNYGTSVLVSTKDSQRGMAYMGAYKDSQLFNALRANHLLEQSQEKNKVSPLMPIEFEFTIHGISGIKRGDKFKVRGIPEKYSNGFFQVLSVSHTVDGMLWKTQITGGYRQ